MDNPSQPESSDQVTEAGIDLNHATLKELTAIPGLGKVMASRIIEGRPYHHVDDLLKVKGISPALLERFGTFLTLTPKPTGEPPMLPSNIERKFSREVITLPTRSTSPPIIELPAYADESQSIHRLEDETSGDEKATTSEYTTMNNRQLVPYKSSASNEEEAFSTDKPAPRDATVARQSDLVKVCILTGLASIILSVFLTLGILAAINSSLLYTPARRFEELRRQSESMSEQVEVMAQDIDSLRNRVDSLETISGRVSSLEKDTDAIQNELETQKADVDRLEKNYQRLAEQTADMQSSIDIFDRFLDGMRSLLADLLSLQP